MGPTPLRFDFSIAALSASPFQDGQPTPPICIIGRSLSYEVERDIPVDSWLEARQVADNIPIPAPFNGIRRVRLEAAGDGGFRALISLIDINRVQEQLGNVPKGLIPVSWLTPALTHAEAAEVDFLGEQLMLVRSGPRFITAVAKSDEQRRDFWWSVDIEADNVVKIDADDALNRLSAALWSMEWHHWVEVFRGFTAGSSFQLARLDWVKVGQTFGICLAGYLMLTSLVLGFTDLWFQEKAGVESPAFSEALSLKGDINRLAAEDEEWASLVGPQYPVWAIWPILKGAREDNIFITSLKYDEGVVEIFVLAEEATDVLDEIIANPFVYDASFGTPVQKDPRTKLDRFSITWKVDDDKSDSVESGS